MVNYDLPWNPNRLEQRFGRIHRIGQTEVCHLWNLVAPRRAKARSTPSAGEAGKGAPGARRPRLTMCWASCSRSDRCASC